MVPRRSSFDPVTVADRNVRATVKLPDDALLRDNVFHFVVSPEAPVRVVIADRPGAQRNTSLYLSRAVAVSESPRIEARIRPADSLSAEDIGAATVIILNDAPVAQATAERLKEFVERGGGLFLAMGERADWPGAVDLLPAAPGPPVDRSRGSAARLGALEYGHPLFEVFRGPRTGDFASARLYNYRSVTPAANVQTLARFDDGAPALLERRVGAGRVLMWTSTLDTNWTDLALKPVFVPFVHRIVRYLGGYRDPRPWRTVGDVVDPGLQAPRPAPSAGSGRVAGRGDARRSAGVARWRRAGSARARRTGVLRVPEPGPGRRRAGGRRQQREPCRVGPRGPRSDKRWSRRRWDGRGARLRVRRRRRPPTRRRNRRSGCGGICCLPASSCSGPKQSWPTD